MRNTCDSSDGMRSHKASCDKKQKLSLMSKRPSLRKINDFISFQSEESQPIIKNVQKQNN